MGMNNDVTLPWMGRMSRIIAVILAAGYVSIPTLIFLGLVIK
jgi:succinate dehydrogenase / fumarate reductase cytochrome b subunit